MSSQSFTPEAFGKYFLVDRIATGGMAEIFKAKTFSHGGFENLLVIKRILPHIGENKEFVSMFVDEAKISAALQHPNIVRVYDFGKILENSFIAMECVDGKDIRNILRKLSRKKQWISEKFSAYVAQEVCKGLHYAHTKTDLRGESYGIVHRDISPSNVLVSYEGEVKVADFGIAKAEANAYQTRDGMLKGKFEYMSPEQALGRKLDHRSDVFSLGSCLYEMLTRIPPFTATNEMDLLIKVRDAKYRPISELTPGIPPELEAIADKCLTRSRANRYQTAAEAETDLRAFLRKFMPNYSRSHLGRFIRKMFAQEIERELRMLEEYVLDEEVSDDVGESLMARDEDYEPPEVPFHPKPTSVSILAIPESAHDFSGG